MFTPNTQAFTNQTSVTVTHNAGYYPIVQVIDASGTPDTIDFELSHTSTNEFVVSFGVAQSGTILIGVQAISGIAAASYTAPTPQLLGH